MYEPNGDILIFALSQMLHLHIHRTQTSFMSMSYFSYLFILQFQWYNGSSYLILHALDNVAYAFLLLNG